MRQHLVEFGLILALVLFVSAVHAQPNDVAQSAESDSAAPSDSVEEPTETSIEQEGSCFPACREGFVCHRQQCVSMCNPPCDPDEACVEGRRCEAAPREPAAPGEDIHEPPPPPLKGFAEQNHTAITFYWGLGGSGDRSGNLDFDLNNTYGLSVRSDAPIARYILLGPIVNFGLWQRDVGANSPGRSFFVDLALYLRARIPIETPKTNYQLWFGVPIGVTASIANGDYTEIQGLGPGWNIGVMGGGAVHFSKKLGLMAELGWQQHRMHHPGDEPGLPAADFRLSQVVINLGFIFKN